MIPDRLNTFGTAQAITTSGPSTDVVELDARAFQGAAPSTWQFRSRRR